MDKVQTNQSKKQGGQKRGAKSKNKRGLPTKSGSALWFYGFHAVQAALQNPHRKVMRFLATSEGLARLSRNQDLQRKLEQAETVDRTDIEKIVGAESVHQGLALPVTPMESVDLQDALNLLEDTQPALFVALDQVTDPHNVGAVIRSAAAFGASAVITTRHNAPKETGALAKAASGALETVPLIQVTNLKRAFKDCQDRGFWTVGLDAQATDTLDQIDLPARCVVVLGAEGSGIRDGVRQTCDFMARLPITGAVASLNVSNAAAIAMYDWARRCKENT